MMKSLVSPELTEFAKAVPFPKAKFLKAKTCRNNENVFNRTAQFFSWFFRSFLLFLHSHRFNNSNSIRESKIITVDTQNSIKFIKTIKLIMFAQKAIRILRNRTIYRPLKLCNKELQILNDYSYFITKTKQHGLIIINSKTFRLIKRNFKKIVRFCSNNLKFRNIYFKTLLIFIILIVDCFKKLLKKIANYIPVIMPDRKAKVVWDTVVIIIICIFFCIIPMQLCFNIFYDDELEKIFEELHIHHMLSVFFVSIPDLLLIIDTILKFITGFYEDGVVIVEKSKIIKHYLKKGLIFDIFSYFPVIVQGVLRKSYPLLFEHHAFAIKVVQLLMFFKIKRVTIALSNFEEIITSHGGNDYILKIFKLIFVIFFITHLNACIWHGTAYFIPVENVETWLDSSNLKEEYWLIKYLHALYWSISMMATINYDNVSPQNNFELFVGAFIVIISVLLFGYTINTMKQILDLMTKEENDNKFHILFILFCA